MPPFDTFSIAAAIIALLLAAGFAVASLLNQRLAPFRRWAAAFFLLGVWLGTSTLHPAIAGSLLRWTSWASLFAAMALLVLGLSDEETARHRLLVPTLACGALLVLTGATLTATGAPPHMWMVWGTAPTALLLAWCAIVAARQGGWLEALGAVAAIATLAIRAGFHPAGAIHFFGPPPGLRGGLAIEGGAPPMIGIPRVPPPSGGTLGPTLVPVVEHALAVTLVTIAALVLLAGVLVLRELLAELDRMRHRSSTDAMTGLLNRAAFEDTARAMLAEPALQPICVAMLDIDHFKRINDTAGHAAGDRVIMRLGRLLGELTILRTAAGRVGGEEFAVLLAGCNLDTGRLFAETIRGGFAASDFGSGVDWTVTLSAGIAQHQPGESLDALVARADRALYAAKAEGRDRVRVAADPGNWTGTVAAA